MRLCGLHFTIEHIPSGKNIWADTVSRWHTREIVAEAAVQTRSHHIVPVEDLSPLRSPADDQFVFPKCADIHAAQLTASRERSWLQHASEEEDGVVTKDNRLWVPTSAKDLLARNMVLAHCGSQGHRGQDAVTLMLKERFYVMNVDDKVAKFVRQCLLCKHVKGPRQIPRPYGPLLTPTQRNEVEHWDFLSLGESYGDSKYLLVVKDGLSHFCELLPCATPTAYVTAEPLTLCPIYATVEMFTGLPVSSSLDAIAEHAGSERAERVIDLRDIGGFVDQLRSSLFDIHREVADAKERQRLRDMAAHKGTPVNVDVDDFVL
ncbi:hypothetical protein ON010_g11791 [Phytophthora cinnamomi]|nr:hypothetical protein ON010_g11791 [Phytophthora cinnamomi]